MIGNGTGFNFPGLSNIESILRLIAGNIALLTTAIQDAFPEPYTSSKTWDPGSVSSGAQTSTTITVAGATLGQRATASFSLSLAGLVLSSYVSAADTVTVILSNLSGSPVDLSSGTLKAWVWQN